ncbi:MAG: diguanylate cyclase [Candidatus Metalachnospira sp.]|nr:diguanylate cyclase [Candidatus Metalachnospira sp.]
MLQLLVNKIRKTNYARKLYFENAKEEIAELNLSLLKILSLTITLLILIFILVTPFIVIGWHPTLQHLLFAPSTALFLLISYFYDKTKKISNKAVNFLCIMFCALIMLFVISIDVFPYRNAPSSFMPIVLIVFPVLFIFRFRLIYFFMLLFEIMYIISLFFYKSDLMFQNDLFNSLVGITVSFVVAWITMSLRVESYNSKNKYRQLSTIDALTGVLNKNNCEREIKEYLYKQEDNQKCSLIIIDIDNFKMVNDRLGHQIGDEVLERVGRLLIHSFDTTDIIGRIGGDEFAILMDNVSDKYLLKKKCEFLNLRAETMSERVNFHIGFSMGVAIQKESRVTYEEMFKSADDALYEAKAFCKGQYIIHTVSRYNQVDNDKKIMLISVCNQLDRSILANKFINEFKIIEASNCEETLNNLCIYSENVNIVILDMMMPQKKGYKLLKYMKSRDSVSNIPVIAIEPRESMKKKAIDLGAAGVLYKPIDENELKLSIMNALKNTNKTTAE